MTRKYSGYIQKYDTAQGSCPKPWSGRWLPYGGSADRAADTAASDSGDLEEAGNRLIVETKGFLMVVGLNSPINWW